MFLSWWRGLVQTANPKNGTSKSMHRRRVPRKFRSALNLEQLETRVVPVTGKANIFLNLQNATAQLNTITAVRGATVPVFIDFDGQTATANGGIGGGTYYILYDPAVLSLSETPTSLGADIKLGSALSSLSANYTLAVAVGETTGMAAIGLVHSGNTFLSGTPTGHLIEVDFHVVASTNQIGSGTLIDLQKTPTTLTGATVTTNQGDIKATSYVFNPTPLSYAEVFPANTLSTLTQPGATTPSTFVHTNGPSTLTLTQPTGTINMAYNGVSAGPFSFDSTTTPDLVQAYLANIPALSGTNAVTVNGGAGGPFTISLATGMDGSLFSVVSGPATFTPPTDADTTDVSVQIVTKTPKLAPTAVADLYSTAPNTTFFTTTMTVTGQASGVLGNDTKTANGAMTALLTTASNFSATPVAGAISALAGLSETGMVVTVTTTAANNIMPGEAVTIAGVGTSAYNGTYEVASVVDSTHFTYNVNPTDPSKLGLTPDSGAGTPTATTAATTIYQATTTDGTVWLSAIDGSFAYSPAANFTGTDSFTYEAVDAASNTDSANTTVTIYVGGLLNIPRGINKDTSNLPIGIGSQVVVPVNILNPDPINSGGLGNATIAINYDPNVFDPANISIDSGSVNGPTGANWAPPTTNTNNPGQIIITTADTGGALPITLTTGGSLALITFNVIGLPTSSDHTSIINLAGATPTVSQLDVIGTGTPVALPMAFAPVDNTSFNGSAPGILDGTVQFPGAVTGNTTSTAVTAAVSGSAVSTVVYGTPVTLTAVVTDTATTTAPTLGSVDFKDGGVELGNSTTPGTQTGNTTTFVYITTLNQLQVIQANGGVHTITANYNPGAGFLSSSGTLASGLAVTPASLTITALTNTKSYDGTATAAATPTVSGLIGSDHVTGLAEAYTNKNAGTGKTLSVSAYSVQDGNGGADYTVTTVSNTTGSITKAALTISASTNTKAYDSTITAAATPTVAGLQSGDTVTGLSEVYANANAGASKTLSLSPTYTVNDGNGGNNYTVTTAANTTGVITKAALTITAATNTKGYNSTTAATATPGVSGLVGNDSVTGQAEVYASANAGTGKTLSVSAYTVVDGNGGANYAVATVTNTTGVINKAALTISAATNTKVYDSTTSAAATPGVVGLQGADTVTGQAEVYTSASAGTGKTLGVSAYTINDGNGGNNYAVTTTVSTTGAITQAALTITATTNTKNYDSKTSAAAAPTVSGLVGGDTVTGLAEVYTDANAGASKTLSVSAYTVNDSNSGNNYTVTTVTNTTGVINKAAVTITAVTNTKTYDSKTSAAATPTVAGLVGGDTATGLVEVYTDANAGASKTLSVSTYTINDGNSGANYAVTTVASTTGLINKAALTINAASNTKTYDTSTVATAVPLPLGLQGFDTVTNLAEVYTDANAGTGKTLSIATYTVNDNNGGNNYTVTTGISTTGVINQAALTITAITNTKAYDATNTAAATPTVSGLQGGDTVSGLVEVYSSKNAGTGKTLSVSGYNISDNNGGNNYSVTTVANTTGVVTKVALTITATTNTKTYDATVTAAATPTVSGLKGTDTVTGMTEVYSSANAGTGKSLSIGTYTVNDGNGGGNYSITFLNNLTGVINKAALTITAITNTKPFDNSVTAAAIPTVSGLQGTDTVTGLAEVYANVGPGASIPLSVSAYNVNDGNSGNNYTVATVGATGAIASTSGFATSTVVATSQTPVVYGTPVTFTITVTDTGNSQAPTGTVEVFDNGSHDLGAATFVSSSGASSTYTLATLAKTLNVTSPQAHVITANFAGGATFASSVGTLAGGQTVTPKALTITATSNTKTYDSTTTAGATPTVSGLVAGDTVTGLSEAYTSASAGTGKTETVAAGFTVNDGNSGANYTVTTASDTTGVINKAALTITATTNTKNYDSKTTAAATPTVSGLVGGDTVTGLSEAYANANAGTGKTLSVNSGYTVNDGNSGGNYTVTTVADTTGAINKAALTITATTNTKNYDSTTTAAATPTVSGLVGGDTVTGLSEAYASASAGTGKTLSVNSGYTVNDGNSGGNYTVTTVTNTTGAINTAALTITAVTNTKPFDNSVTAAAIPTVSGLQGSDTVTGLAEVYANVGPGASIPLSVSAYNVIDGNGGNNYTVSTVGATGAITSTSGFATSTAVATSQTPVVYGTPVTFTITVTDTGSSQAPTGTVEVFDNGSHDLGAATFVSSSGTASTYTLSTLPKTLNVTSPQAHVITANFAGGSTFASSVGTLAGGETVTPKALTITATSNTKTYDSTTTAGATPTVSGLVAGDTVTGLSEAYTSASAGTGKTETVAAGFTVNDGNSGANYTVTTASDTTGVINKAALTITATTNTKNYDSKTTAAATPTVSGLVGGDTVTGLSEAYANANAGTGKTLSVNSGYTVNDANSGGNYTVTTVTNTTGAINKAALTITATTNTKNYDSTTTAAATPTVSGLVGGDTVTGLSEAYASASAGTGKTLSVNSGYTVNDGNSGGNYTVTTVTNTTGAINKAALTITATTNTKNYDSTTTAAATPTVSGLVGGDTVTGLSEAYASASAGTGKTLSVNSGYTVNDGNSGGNYTVTTVTNTTGAINKAALTITATTNTKTYDSKTTAAAVPTVSGLVGGDTVTGLSEAYANANTGTGKTLSVNSGYTVNDGNSGGNYTVSTVANTTGVINKAALTITALTNTKAFDNSVTAAAIPTVSGLQGSDTVTGLAEVYANVGPGASIPLSVSAYTVNDGNTGNNYTVATVGATGAITNTGGFATSTAVTTSQTPVVYGTPVTFTVTVTDTASSPAPTGTVEVFDNGSHDLGAATFVSSSGAASTYTLSTLPKTLNVTSPAAHVITANFTGGTSFANSVGTLAGGETVTPKALTITATTNTKNYDSKTTAAATPTVSGLVAGDTVTGLSEAYANANAGTGKTLSVTGYSVSDGNGGGNYTVTTVNNTTGAINKGALTITAVTFTKTFDGTTNAPGATPTVAGLVGGDTVTGAAEQFANAGPGTGITLSVSAYTVNDGNGGNNYTVTTVTNSTGEIDATSTGVSITNTSGPILEPPMGAKEIDTFTVSLGQAVSGDVYANYSTVNGTAKAGTDYSGVTNATVKIPAGSTSVTIPITVLGDAPEPLGGPADEYFTIIINWTASSNGGTPVVQTSSATGDIKQTFVPTISMPATQVVHMSGGTYGVQVNLASTYPTAAYANAAGNVIVSYYTSNGTAKSGTNYKGVSGNLNIPAGDFAPGGPTSVIIPVTAIGAASGQTLNMNLGSISSNGGIGAASGSVSLFNPQLAIGTPTPGAGGTALTSTSLAPVISVAEANWEAAGAKASSFSNVHFQIGTIGHNVLGNTAGSMITIDANAAGFGWYTGTDNSAFQQVGSSTNYVATAGGPAANLMDLLTVVQHELGHILGLDDTNPGTGPDTLMTETLAAGERRMPAGPVVAPITPCAPPAGTTPPQGTHTLPVVLGNFSADGLLPVKAKGALTALDHVFSEPWSDSPATASTDALDQVFAVLGSNKVKK